MSERSSPGDAARVLSINAGSSSIRFALYDVTETLLRHLRGKIGHMVSPEQCSRSSTSTGARTQSRPVAAGDPEGAAAALFDWLEEEGLLRSQGSGTPCRT